MISKSFIQERKTGGSAVLVPKQTPSDETEWENNQYDYNNSNISENSERRNKF